MRTTSKWVSATLILIGAYLLDFYFFVSCVIVFELYRCWFKVMSFRFIWICVHCFHFLNHLYDCSDWLDVTFIDPNFWMRNQNQRNSLKLTKCVCVFFSLNATKPVLNYHFVQMFVDLFNDIHNFLCDNRIAGKMKKKSKRMTKNQQMKRKWWERPNQKRVLIKKLLTERWTMNKF